MEMTDTQIVLMVKNMAREMVRTMDTPEYRARYDKMAEERKKLAEEAEKKEKKLKEDSYKRLLEREKKAKEILK
jgi:hypothetical protein